MSSALRARLDRLRRTPAGAAAIDGAAAPRGEQTWALPPGGAAPAAGDQLGRLERSLLGATAGELSLKARLERLVAATASRMRAPAARALEQLVPGRAVRNSRGEFYLIEHELPIDSFHGDVPLSRLRAVGPESVRVLAGEPEIGAFELEQAVFLDTETTGIAGGAGTAAFLIGIGFLLEDRFVVRQYFMRDYEEEPAMLLSLAEDLARFRHVVTFNGKLFDLPLLETRYRLLRERLPLAAAVHLDLLHPARRLWKLRLESCRLVALEAALLGLLREHDVAGEEIPGIYFRYVRSRDARALGPIFTHNSTDIVSLAALSALACQWIDEERAEDPRDVLSLARVLERASLFERSEAAYRRAMAVAEGPVRSQALMRLASQAKRHRRFASAAELWSEAAAAGQCWAYRELAIHHERRRRDAAAALSLVDRALRVLAARGDPCCRRTAEDFKRRRARLLAKAGRIA
jgi:uncharacterized protein YprB with RNaseH-like and TPR domain